MGHCAVACTLEGKAVVDPGCMPVVLGLVKDAKEQRGETATGVRVDSLLREFIEHKVVAVDSRLPAEDKEVEVRGGVQHEAVKIY